MNPPTVSVIIATYSRAPLLDECLHHLAGQPFMAGDEIIVVDNGSPDDTPVVVRRHQTTYPAPLHLLHESTPGKSHALARALQHARADVLAFLDDDVNVDDGWLHAVRRTMAGGGISLMGGRVLPRWEATVPQWLRRATTEHPRLGAPLGLLDYPREVVELGRRTVLGANMAAKREVVAAVGGFAPHLGKLRGTLLSGEDHDFCQRVQRAGFRAVYEAGAVVHHWVPAHRARTGYFLHWFYWSGITYALLDPVPERRAVGGLPWHLIKRAVQSSLAAALALARGRRDVALDRAADVAFAAGYAVQRWGLGPRQPSPAPSAVGGAI